MPSTAGRALSRMAENSQADLSFEGILQILAKIPAEKLKDCRHKLSCLPPDQSSCRLLQVMILWRLGERDEARMQLSSLWDDVAAAHLYKCCWGDGEEKRVPREQDERVAQAVAEIYSLLGDEKLCGPLAGEGACREAVRAFQASNVPGIRFTTPLDEAGDKRALPLLIRSDPVPVERSSPPDLPRSLRSKGSPISSLSSFEISDSSSTFGMNKPCRGAARPLTPTRQAEGSGHEGLANGCSESPGEPILQNASDAKPFPAASQEPTQCTPNPSAAASELLPPAGALPAVFPPPLVQQPGTAAFAGGAAASGAGFSAPTQSAGRGPISPPDLAFYSSPGASSVALEDEKQFYTFVVLHAREDEPIACRVKEQLESLGVSNGATFSEDFLVPGQSQLSCFQKALDNSAFTLLLLTTNFKGHLCAYQRDTALMDSLRRVDKRDSVIPFVPKESSRGREEMNLLLASLEPLSENCPTFKRKVARTFTAKRILEKKQLWEVSQKIREKEQQQEQMREYLRMQQRLSELSLQLPAAAPAMGCPGFQAPFGPAAPCFPPPAMAPMHPGPEQASLPHPFLFSVGGPSTTPSGGPPPQLIIQNAQMVQIGDYNHMHVETGDAAPGAAAGAP